MNLNKLALSTVYKHKDADSHSASSKLFESLMTNIDDNSKLIRLTPTMFICVQSTDDDKLPKCFMVNTTDNDHWVGKLDTINADEDELPKPEELGIGNGSTNSDGSTTLGSASDVLGSTMWTIDDDNLPTDDPRDDVIVRPSNVPASYFNEYDHNCANCDEASQMIESVLSKKYGSHIIRHSPTEFTQVRGKTIDHVSSDNNKHYIRSSSFQSK